MLSPHFTGMRAKPPLRAFRSIFGRSGGKTCFFSLFDAAKQPQGLRVGGRRERSWEQGLCQDIKMTSREESRCTKFVGSNSCCLSNGGHISFMHFRAALMVYFCKVSLNYIFSCSLMSKYYLEAQKSR